MPTGAGWALNLSGGEGGGSGIRNRVSSEPDLTVCESSFLFDGAWDLTNEALGTCWPHLLIL